MKKFKAVNLNPFGFEKQYIVVEPSTGREVGINLEEDEAIKIENVDLMWNYLKKTRNYLEELYLHTFLKDTDFLSDINNMITKIDILTSKIEKSQ